jgi:diguanylate cyclase (GGDEF)-like protein/PAS domain S-box-containing protein
MQDSLLLVDDEPNVSKSLERLLRKEDYQIHVANSGEEALAILQKHKIKVIISDQRMPHMTGAQLFAQVKDQYPETIRIIISGYTDFQSVSDAINKGSIYKFLAKPWNNELIRAEIREAFNTQGLIQHNQQLSHLFDSTIEAIAICNEKGHIESVNPAFCNLSHLTSEEVTGKPLMELFSTSNGMPLPNDVLTVNPEEEWHGELACRKGDGYSLPVWLSFMAIKGPYNELYYAALFIDISEQKKKEAHIEFQAYHDSLTGLANRRLFNDHLELAINQCNRDQKELAILFMDLDRFKIINDNLGHTVGDALLIEVAKRLRKAIRKGETLARFGGDEFVIILTSAQAVQDAEQVANKVLNLFTEPFKIGRHSIYVSPSIGINTSMNDDTDSELLVCHADSAMYKAKAIGGNTFQFYDNNQNTITKDQLRIEHSLHDAVKNDEFLLHYQPQVNPVNGDVVGNEALVRWQHPDNGIQGPASFIALVEQNGLILPIGKRVLHQACSQLSKWWQHEETRCKLSVNLSARQFNDPNLLNDICELIHLHRLQPSWLEIEVTESILINDLQGSIHTLNELRKIGVGIALDDFGTGYSSLSYLQQLPITTLKIDQSFIQDLPTNKKSCSITKLLLGLARDLDMQVVAEGVETQAQFDFLKDAGCDLIQGYFVSRPVCARKFEEFIKEHHSEKALQA